MKLTQECWKVQSAGVFWTSHGQLGVLENLKHTRSDQFSAYESFQHLADASWGTNAIVLHGDLPHEHSFHIKIT